MLAHRHLGGCRETCPHLVTLDHSWSRNHHPTPGLWPGSRPLTRIHAPTPHPSPAGPNPFDDPSSDPSAPPALQDGQSPACHLVTDNSEPTVRRRQPGLGWAAGYLTGRRPEAAAGSSGRTAGLPAPVPRLTLSPLPTAGGAARVPRRV